MIRSVDVRRLLLAGACALAFAVAPLVIRAQSPQAATGAPAAAPSGGTPHPITLADYPRFKRITAPSISNDGKWLLYTVTPNEGDGTLVVKSLDTEKVYEIPRGTGAVMSDNAHWAGTAPDVAGAVVVAAAGLTRRPPARTRLRPRSAPSRFSISRPARRRRCPRWRASRFRRTASGC
jgi:hypothetical protein